MWKRFFIVLLLLLVWKPSMVEAHAPFVSIDYGVGETQMEVAEERNTDNEQGEKTTAKQAHDHRQKWAFIILGIIFLISIICFVAVGWLMRKSEK